MKRPPPVKNRFVEQINIASSGIATAQSSPGEVSLTPEGGELGRAKLGISDGVLNDLVA